MLPNAALDQLRDIHPPADIGWWPVAFSWWVLLALGIATLISTCLILFRKHKKNAWRRAALIEIKRLKAKQGHTPSNAVATELCILIKRCLYCSPSNKHTGDTKALSSCGYQFISILDSTISKSDLPTDLKKILSEDLYKSDCPDITADHLLSVEMWIKGLAHA